jgi:hypothetical protein
MKVVQNSVYVGKVLLNTKEVAEINYTVGK